MLDFGVWGDVQLGSRGASDVVHCHQPGVAHQCPPSTHSQNQRIRRQCSQPRCGHVSIKKHKYLYSFEIKWIRHSPNIGYTKKLGLWTKIRYTFIFMMTKKITDSSQKRHVKSHFVKTFDSIYEFLEKVQTEVSTILLKFFILLPF